ncbi:MAG: leucyl aminopeptidase [Candidatus Obscuribacterales bacterium]|jgi:leucyl aminopeptidase|nr:leucyl aminopeptidase [Candidatus Obscuribacterales bacterium]
MTIEFSARSSKMLGRALARNEERANLILAIFSGEGLTGYALEADQLTNGLLSRRMAHHDFDAKSDKVMVIDTDLSVEGLDRIILVGLGARSKLTRSGLRSALVEAFESARDSAHSKHLVFPLIDTDLRGLTVEDFAETVASYAVLMDYEINHQKTREESKTERTHLQSMSILTADWALSATKRGMNRGKLIAEATCKARDMVNEPSETMNPAKLARIAKEIADASNGTITCKVYGKKAITKLGMNGFLAVNEGSIDEPQLIDLTFTAAKKDAPTLGLIGKGVTFDAGGLGIKDGTNMKNMKNDMGGAAAVLATMSLLAALKPSINVRAVIAATDNLVDANSFRPGRIITTMSGLTVQVDHTDAEGRLTLCDALTYLQQNGVNQIIDLATLTGAVEEALGNYITGVFGNDKKFTRSLLHAAERAGEEMWEMPMTEHHRDLNKCAMADLTNDGANPGHIAAAWFLREFVKEGTSWIHLDIAGTSFRTEEIGVDPEGATGVGVRTLVELILNLE